MNQKIIIKITSFMLCIVLFILDILFLTFFNISRGIKKNEITKLIDNINIKEEFEYLDSYNKLESTDKQLVDEILSSNEIEEYIKENIKALYLNICYEENTPYIGSNKFRAYVNTKIEEQQEIYGISEESIEKILNVTNEIINSIEKETEIQKNEDTKIIREILSKKTSNYLLIGIIIISLFIILINKSYESLLWLGIPTILSGILFLILGLSLDGNINTININAEILGLINNYLKTLIKTIKIISKAFITIGIVEYILYIILKYKKGENNGNN